MINEHMGIEYQELEASLLSQAVEAVYQETGLRFKYRATEGLKYDATIEIEGYEHLRFTAEVKRWAQQANIGVLINQIKQLPGRGILIADYVNSKMADQLRKRDVPFIDAAGNAYINEKPLYIFIKGNKNRARNEMAHAIGGGQTRGRAFQPAGIKMLYALIRTPKLVKAPYRDIVNITGVALGTVGKVFDDLKQSGYLIGHDRKHQQLTNKKQLLTKWVDAYLEKLKPKLFLGTFSAENEYWWKDLVNIEEYGARWGGEVAAAKLTGYLKPEKITVYLSKIGGQELLAKNRFRKDPSGNIQVYRAFWEADESSGFNCKNIVDPMIVYADLLVTGDPRNLETARMLYDKELAGFIGED